jgi:hypothetical protein
LSVPSGWEVSGNLDAVRDVPSGELARWSFQVQVPADADPSQAYYLTEPRAGGLYWWPPDLSLLGAPANPDVLQGRVRFELGELGEVEGWEPARFRGVDKATGEFVKPVLVVPALSVTLDPPFMALPSGDETAREFQVSVVSQSALLVNGSVTLELPEGWVSAPEEHPVFLSGVGAEASFSFQVRPRPDAPDGRYSVTARVDKDDGRRFETGVIIVDYPHIRRTALFPRARSTVSVLPVSVPAGIRVGYVMGSGDVGPEAIRQMGLEVELLGPDAVRAGEFASYDVVVLGIRAYETRPDLVVANDGLLDFVRAGGTLIVQYNQYEFPAGGFAPFQVGMNRPHDRVSDEAASVRILDPSHPVFRSPNRIVPRDFDGWVQERGLYFLSSWAPEFSPLLEMADPGEDPKQGGLLVAKVGDGIYVYTGLAFFRQFPEAVPGAYRLFANLLSLRAEDLR